MSPKKIHKGDGYNMILFKSGSHNDAKKRTVKIFKISWEDGACNTGLIVGIGVKWPILKIFFRTHVATTKCYVN